MNSTSLTHNEKRFISLDILRFLAVLLVMLRHSGINPVASKIGWIGVDLFFVLSGFLVSGLLFKEYLLTNKVSYLNFFVRRACRIYPSFWVVLLIYLCYFSYKGQPIIISRILSELFFVQNFFEGVMGITWSIAIEEHFYILLLLLIGLAIRFRRISSLRWVTGFCVIICSACLALRIELNMTRDFNVWTHFFPTYLRIDSLLFGVLISWFYHFRKAQYDAFISASKYYLLFLIILGLALPFIYPYDHWIMNTIGLSLLYLSFGSGLALLMYSPIQFTTPILGLAAKVGQYSYPIYLIHMLCGFAVANYFRVHFFPGPELEFINVLIYLFANIFIGVLLSIYVEQPILKWRDRNFPAAKKLY